MSKISRRAFTGLAAASVGTLAFPSISLGAVPRVVVMIIKPKLLLII